MKRLSIDTLLLLLLLALVAGCTERVATAPINFTTTWSPALKCAGDPRRPDRMKISAACSDRTVEVEFSFAEPTNELLLPLGDCTITAEVYNAHGRMVLSGSSNATYSKDDNTATLIELVEVTCSDCDSDGDGIVDEDELAMQLNVNSTDSDGDNIQDGLEVFECCSDPNVASSSSCDLLIQSVVPSFAKPDTGNPITVTAVTTIDLPENDTTYTIGGATVVSSTIGASVLGELPTTAVLGEIEVATPQASATHSELFAVLRDTPREVFQIGGEQRLTRLIDMTTAGSRVIMLLEDPTNMVPTTLAVHNQATELTETYTVEPPAIGTGGGTVTPVAVDATGTHFVVIFRSIQSSPSTNPVGASPDTKVVFGNLDSGAIINTKSIKGRGVDVRFLSSGTQAAVLLRGAGPAIVNLAATSFMGSNNGANIGPGSSPNQAFLNCTGIARLADNTSIANESLYVSCNAQNNAGIFYTTGSFGNCLSDSGVKTESLAGCFGFYETLGQDELVGKPVIDTQNGMVYALAKNSGVVGISLDAPSGSKLQTLVPFQWRGNEAKLRPMVLDGNGFLYVVDGRHVRRTRPAATEPDLRVGKPFPLGVPTMQPEIVSLALSGDGSVLDAARSTNGTLEFMSVCLARAQAKLCK